MAYRITNDSIFNYEEERELVSSKETKMAPVKKKSRLAERYANRNFDLELDMSNKKDREAAETFRLIKELNTGDLFKQFEDIITFLTELYLQDNKEWIDTYSGGKDSTLVLSLLFKMLQRLPKEKRTKRIHIVSADTKVESKQMTTYLKKNLELIKQFEEELNLVVHLVEPDLKNSFFWNVIGRGVVAPKPPSPFQWCTKKMKINPMNKKMDEIISEAPINLSNVFNNAGIESKEVTERPYDVMMLVGSRLDESVKRANSIKKYSDKEQELFGRNPDYHNVKMCYPIKYVKTSDLWAYIMAEQELPWGLPTSELFDMYSDGSGECPMTQDELTKAKGCGSTNSRNGCWVCLYAGRNDKMLETLISSGQTEVKYLAEWKAFLYDVTYDVRYREPLRRREVEENNKKVELTTFENEDLFSLLPEDKIENDYLNFERAKKTEYVPGGFTFEMRLMLLQKLLYTQKKVGYELLEKEELNAILKNWEEEGYEFSEDDIRDYNHQYDGAVVLNKDGSINKKETKNDQSVFRVRQRINLGKTELINFIKERQKLTGKSYYCFFDNKDIKNTKFAFNFLTFIVCKEGINSKMDAKNEIFKWLYYKKKTDRVNKFTKESMKLAIDSLLLKDLDQGIELREGIKETLNVEKYDRICEAQYIGKLGDSSAILKDEYSDLQQVDIQKLGESKIQDNDIFQIVTVKNETHYVKDKWSSSDVTIM